MKRPFLSTSCTALLAFFAFGYVGYFAALRIAYRYKQSTSFRSLGSEEALQFRSYVQTLQEFQLSRILTQNTQESLQRNIDHLQNLRARAPRDLWPLLDLRIATDHATIARLKELANQPDDGNIHRQTADTVFRSLGWQDVSEAALNEVADKQLQSSLRK